MVYKTTVQDDNLREAIRAWIKEHGDKQKLFARQARITDSQLSDFLNKNRGLGVKSLRAVCNFLHWDFERGGPRSASRSRTIVGVVKKRPGVHMLSPATFTEDELATLPDTIDLDEIEALLVLDRRSQDPYTCLKTAKHEIELGYVQLADSDKLGRYDFQTAIDSLESVIKRAAARRGKPIE